MEHVNKNTVQPRRAFVLKLSDVQEEVKAIEHQCIATTTLPTSLGATIDKLVQDALELRDLYLLRLLDQGETHRSAANSINHTHSCVANALNRINRRNKTAKNPVNIPFDISPYITKED